MKAETRYREACLNYLDNAMDLEELEFIRENLGLSPAAALGIWLQITVQVGMPPEMMP